MDALAEYYGFSMVTLYVFFVKYSGASVSPYITYMAMVQQIVICVAR